MKKLQVTFFGIFLSLLTASIVFASQPQTSNPDFAAIDAYVETQIKEIPLPGLALGIVKGDQVVHIKAFGEADASGRPVTTQTPFHIASLGKSFTALAIMQLVEAGKVELDAPVQRYLPWFRVADADASALITVRQLLNQTSGISSTSDTDILIQNYTGPNPLEQSVQALSTTELNRPIGESFQYANINYVILGLIVQTVSGQPYAEYIQDHVFNPLDMTTAYLDSHEDQERGAAVGHAYWFGIPRPTSLLHFPGQQPAGADSFSASVEDMSHYMIAQLNGGRFGEQNVLSADGISTLHEPAVPTGAPDTFYGMGWENSIINGVSVVHHTGLLPGYYSHMLLAPTDGWGVIVQVNADASFFSDRTFAIGPNIINRLHGQTPAPQPANNRWQVYLILVVVLAVQIFGMNRSVTILRRWHVQPESRPTNLGAIAWRIGLPLVVNLVWASAVLFGLPALLNIPLRFLFAYLPDVTTILMVSAVVALGWAIVRTVLLFNLIRKVKQSRSDLQRRFAG